ncbi:hypothetical protein OG21DRAFT_1490573 [Imleria badia]|nr:hypothetical protein OG21DRAFT_1490573 [Imleria badia]
MSAPQGPPASQAASAHSQPPSVPSEATSADAPLGPLTSHATKLHSYPHKFREVIKRAKRISQYTKNGEFFSEAIAESERVSGGYWPQYRKELGVLLRAAIDEYATGTHQDQTFDFSGYSKIFTNFYSMQLKINSHPKHAAKMNDLRVEWAQSAKYIFYSSLIPPLS